MIRPLLPQDPLRPFAFFFPLKVFAALFLSLCKTLTRSSSFAQPVRAAGLKIPSFFPTWMAFFPTRLLQGNASHTCFYFGLLQAPPYMAPSNFLRKRTSFPGNRAKCCFPWIKSLLFYFFYLLRAYYARLKAFYRTLAFLTPPTDFSTMPLPHRIHPNDVDLQLSLMIFNAPNFCPNWFSPRSLTYPS